MEEDFDETEENEKETKDFFEKYNTYYTINIILSYLDKKSLLQLMPLKKRFYSLIKNMLNLFEGDMYLPMFNKNYNNIEELFITYFIYVIKVLKNKLPEKEIQIQKEKLVYNILRNIEGNKIIIEPNKKVDIRPDFYGLNSYSIINGRRVYSPDFEKDLEDDNLSLIGFTEKYGEKFKNNTNGYLYKIFGEPTLFYEHCNFISLVLKLYNIIFNDQHKPKFEIIDFGEQFYPHFSLNKINNEYYLRRKLMGEKYEYNCMIGNNTIHCSELIIKCGNDFNQSILNGCDFQNLKTLKMKNIGYIVNKSQILENIEFNCMVINYDSFVNLLNINKKTLKKITFNGVILFNRIINDIQLQKIPQIISNLKQIEYVKFNIVDFPIKFILFLIISFLENFIKSKNFIFFSLICNKAEIKNISDIPSNFFNKLKIEHNIIKDKFKTFINSKKDDQKGFFFETKDLEYQICFNKNNQIISSLKVLNDHKKYLNNKSYKDIFK